MSSNSVVSVVKKAPVSVLDYVMDWAALTNGTGPEDWLATGDTINTSAWLAQNGITMGNGINGAPVPSNTTTTATVWLLGGTLEADYLVTNRIVTVAGRTHERSLQVQVRTR